MVSKEFANEKIESLKESQNIDSSGMVFPENEPKIVFNQELQNSRQLKESNEIDLAAL